MAAPDDVGLVVWKKQESEDEDIWDDSALIEAYDRAIKSIKADLTSDVENDRKFTTKRKKKVKRKKFKKIWSAGDKCLALYCEDGLFYDAVILSVNSEARTAYVRFDHYGNEEQVAFDDMMPPGARDQLEASNSNPVREDEKLVESDAGSNCLPSSQTKDGDSVKKHPRMWKVSDICYAPDELGRYMQAVINSFQDEDMCVVTFVRNKRKQTVRIEYLKSKLKHPVAESLASESTHPYVQRFTGDRHRPTGHPFFPANLPGVPPFPSAFPYLPGLPTFPPPPFSSFHHAMPFVDVSPGRTRERPSNFNTDASSTASSFKAPPIPPPPMIPDDVIQGNEESMANMLMSWYMSGYHTGYYQALQQKKLPARSTRE